MIVRTFVLAATIALLCGPDVSAQERLVATHGEARTNLAFRVPEAIVQKILPPGWLSSPFTTGPSKGANLTVTFMDWLTVQEPDGTPGKTYRSVGVSAALPHPECYWTTSPMTGTAPPNRLGGLYGGKDQHGCAA